MSRPALAVARPGWIRTSLSQVLRQLTRLGVRLRLGRRVPILRTGYFAISDRLRPKVTTVGAWTVHFHQADIAVSHALRNDQTYEPLALALIQSLLHAGDCAVDVGANIGLHTLAMAAGCGSHGRVLAFEPDPDNAQLWYRNIRVNGYRNAQLITAALSDSAGVLELHLDENNRGDHRAYDPGGGRRKIAVPSIRLDDALEALTVRPQLVKIDVQGWETHVLAGALRSLGGSEPLVLITEFWTEGLLAAGSSADELVEVMGKLGFDAIFEIDEIHARLRTVPLDRSTLLDSPRDANLIAVRGVPMSLLAKSALIVSHEPGVTEPM